MAKKMKRWLALALALAMTMGLLSITALADGEEYVVELEMGGIEEFIVMSASGTLTGNSGTYSLGHVGGTILFNDYVPADTYTYSITATTLTSGIFEASGTIPAAAFEGADLATPITIPVAMTPKAVDDSVVNMTILLSVGTDDQVDGSKVSLSLTSETDGQTYTASYSEMSGSFSVTVPSNSGYQISLDAPLLGNATYKFARQISLAASMFQTDRRISIGLSETHKVELQPAEPNQTQVAATFEVRNAAGELMPNCQVVVQIGAEQSTYATNENGTVTVTLPLAEKYMVGAMVNNVWNPVDVTPAELTAGTSFPITYAPPAEKEHLENTTITRQIYLDGQLWRSEQINLSLSVDTTHHIPAVGCGGLTVCDSVSVTRNGGEYPSTLHNADTAPNVAIHTGNLADGDALVLSFYYSYTDTDTLYTVSVTHEFYDGDTLVHSEQGESLQRRAGENFTVLAQTSLANLEIQKDIPDYDEGTWYLGMTLLAGGDNSGLVGSFPAHEGEILNYPVISEEMLHSDVEIVFQYFYRQPVIDDTDPYIPPTDPIIPPNTDIPDEDVPLSDLPELNTVDHFAYIVGYGDGTVRPGESITRAEVATIFFRLLTDESREANWATENPFIDVVASNWYNNAVSTAANAGLLLGYSDGTFAPDANITRAEFATIAARFLSEEYDGENLFTDIDGHWAAESINRAAYAGWIQGYEDNTFRPNEDITRAEAMDLINDMLGRNPDKDHLLDNMTVWTDNMDTERWYYAAVQEATNSHDYDQETILDFEVWTALLENRDWAALETEWATSHDAPGGEVID